MSIALANSKAFSLVELLVIVAVVGLVATVSLPLISGIPNAAKKEKLEQDVAIVNNAINAYLASGGSADNLTEAGTIGALKQRVIGSMPAEMMGPQGPFLDPTVVTKPTDFGWSALFTTDPRPRFYVAQSTAGVVFGQGPAMAIGGVAARPDGERPSWLWAYGTATAPEDAAAFVPLAVDSEGGPTITPVAGVTLESPLISPGSLTTSIGRFPLEVAMSNPNPEGSSRIYYRVNLGNYVLFDGTPFQVDPGASLSAVAVSLDPSRYYNSIVATEIYEVAPLQLALTIIAPMGVSYAQAGGIIEGEDQLSPIEVTITLSDSINQLGSGPDNLLVDEGGENKFIPPPYLQSANFLIRYTTDGSDPLASGAQTSPDFSGFLSSLAIPLGLDVWGTNPSITIRAVAVSSRPDWFTSSPIVFSTVSVAKTTLAPPLVSPTNQVVSFAVTVLMSNPPSGPADMSVRYTTNNTAPSSVSGLTYNSPFSLSSFGILEEKPVRAVTVPPPDLVTWFEQSPETVRLYTGPAFAGSGIPSGALVGSATLNSTFNGNITVAYPTSGGVGNISYNRNAVINGSLYVPGTPRVAQNSPYVPRWTPANDAQFANRIYGIVEGQSASPRVVDLTGPAMPSNYAITFNSNSVITGKIFRRIDRYTLTPFNLATFPSKTSSASLSLSGPVSGPLSASNVANVTLNTKSVGSVELLPGTYGNMTANNNSKFVLGNAADPETPVVYDFDSLTLNSGGDVVIVGRVILNIRNAFALSNGAVLGNVDQPDWLQINVWSSSYVNVASGSSVYGRIFAPSGSIAFNRGSTLNGSVSADSLDLNSSSVVFSLSPANSSGL